MTDYLSELKGIARNRGGECLSSRYITAKIKLSWQCSKKHKWEATPDRIKRGTWCPFCAGNIKGSIEEMNKIAFGRGGKCLSKQYNNARSPLRWQCANDHIWKAVPYSIKKGSWCPNYLGRGKTISDMRTLAKKREGECLSKEYISTGTKLRWKCKEGHEWEAVPDSVLRGSWCAICAGVIKKTIKDMRALARQYGGKCLSKKYHGAQKKLLWQCKENHTWEAKPNLIQQKRWCPTCASGRSERVVRAYFEQLFDVKFPKKRPKWIFKITGKRLELDGYNEKLKIAFEHHGNQHYMQHGLFHDDKRSFEKIQENDLLKIKACKRKRVTLVEIPQISIYEKPQLIGKHIDNAIKNAGLKKPRRKVAIDFSDAFDAGYKDDFLKYVKSMKGTLCSDYLGKNIKLIIQCECGYKWQTYPFRMIYNKSWCPKCAGNAKDNIEAIRKIAIERGGELLSKKYINTHTPLQSQCNKCKHAWKARPSSIKSGSWCPKCAVSIRRN